MSAALAVAALFVLAYGLVALLAIRRPLLARLAGREAVRRPGQSLLVVGGLMIGAAAITAALVSAHSSTESAALNAFRTWGMTDLTVTAGNRYFSPEVASLLVSDPRLEGYVDGVQGGIELVGSASDLDRRLGEPGVRIISFDPSSQRPFGHFVLTDGSRTLGDDLGPDEVLLSRQLARELDAREGDRLQVSVESLAPGEPIVLRVAGVARSEGPGAYGLRPSVFAPLPTVRKIAGIEAINVVRISAVGGLTEGLDSSKSALPRVKAAVSAIPASEPLEVREVKAFEVRLAEESSEFLVAMLLGMSALIVAAGTALVVNLAMMLSEERRPQLAVLRALGLRRRGIVTLSVVEGAIYSLVAAVVGTGVGLAAGRFMAGRYAEAWAEFAGSEQDLEFVFTVEPVTLAVAFASGALLTLVTVFLAAHRTSRMSIPAAIRNRPEPASRDEQRLWPAAALLIALTLAGAAGVVQTYEPARLAGGIALVAVAAALTNRRLPGRIHATLTGAALAGWAYYMVLDVDPTDPNKFFAVFTASVLASVFGFSILAAGNLRLLESVLGLLGGRARATLRPPLAYLTRRTLRTGLTTGMFAVVLAILTLFAVFISLTLPNYERDSAGYDIRVTSTGTEVLDLPASVASDVVREASVPTLGYVGPLRAIWVSSEAIFIPLFELSEELLGDPPLRLSQRWEGFETEEEVWETMKRDPSWVIANFAGPGQEITLQGAQGPVSLRVAAAPQSSIFRGIVGTKKSFEPFSAAARGSTLLVDTAPGADPGKVAHDIERSLFFIGVNATPTRDILESDYRSNRTFFSMVEILMRMGLVIGVLALGILGLRIVVERRHVIGVLRALGYRKRAVMAGLMAEAGLTTTIGAAVGFVAGIIMGYLFLRQFFPDSRFGVDSSIATALLLVYVAVVLVTLGPAWRASRLPPAEAVRYTD